MWMQPLDPLQSLVLSNLAASLPILLLLLLLLLARSPGHVAAFISSLVTFVLAIFVWHMPVRLAFSSYAYGALFGLWPITWIVLNAMLLFNLSEKVGSLELLERWLTYSLPRELSLQVLFVSFLFAGFIEGIDGYGFPIAIASAILTRLGLKPITAVSASLLANTITVPFASLGVPLLTLSLVSNLNLRQVAVAASLQLMIFSLILPLCIVKTVSGWSGVRRSIGIALLTGLLLGLSVLTISAYLNPSLAGVLGPLLTMAVVLLYFRLRHKLKSHMSAKNALQGWLPWMYAIALMLSFSALGLNKAVKYDFEIPYLHGGIYMRAYNKPLSAVYEWRPLTHGTLVLISSLLTAVSFKAGPRSLFQVAIKTFHQLKYAMLTITQMMGIAFLMNCSGMTYILGNSLASTGWLFPLFSALIGWLGTFISGSSTGSNALFGALQRASAESANLSPYLTVATNSTGGVLGKIVSLQSVSIGTSAVNVSGKEGEIVRRLLPYSLLLAALLGVLALLQSRLP